MNKISISVGHSHPPYIQPKTGRGLELDILKLAFAQSSVNIEIKYASNARRIEMALNGLSDCTSTIKPEVSTALQYSEPYIFYQNVAVSLTERQLQIKHVSDLAHYSVLAFQKAAVFLGKDFRRAINQSPQYEEVARQEKQILRLFSERVDTIVLDINIFYHYFKEYVGNADTQASFSIHQIFPKNYYRIGCKLPKIIKAFNQGLNLIRNSGQYVDIYKNYHHVIKNLHTPSNIIQELDQWKEAKPLAPSPSHKR